MQPARAEVVWNLTLPGLGGDRDRALRRHDVVALVAALPARVPEVVRVVRVADDGEDRAAAPSRPAASGRAAAGAAAMPAARRVRRRIPRAVVRWLGMGLRFALEGPYPSTLLRRCNPRAGWPGARRPAEVPVSSRFRHTLVRLRLGSVCRRGSGGPLGARGRTNGSAGTHRRRCRGGVVRVRAVKIAVCVKEVPERRGEAHRPGDEAARPLRRAGALRVRRERRRGGARSCEDAAGEGEVVARLDGPAGRARRAAQGARDGRRPRRARHRRRRRRLRPRRDEPTRSRSALEREGADLVLFGQQVGRRRRRRASGRPSPSGCGVPLISQVAELTVEDGAVARQAPDRVRLRRDRGAAARGRRRLGRDQRAALPVAQGDHGREEEAAGDAVARRRRRRRRPRRRERLAHRGARRSAPPPPRGETRRIEDDGERRRRRSSTSSPRSGCCEDARLPRAPRRRAPKGALGVLAKAASLGGEVAGVVVGSGVRELAPQAGAYGAARVYVADDARARGAAAAAARRRARGARPRRGLRHGAVRAVGARRRRRRRPRRAARRRAQLGPRRPRRARRRGSSARGPRSATRSTSTSAGRTTPRARARSAPARFDPAETGGARRGARGRGRARGLLARTRMVEPAHEDDARGPRSRTPT